MDHPVVYAPNGNVRTVKNLGWLLRHWRTVSSFRVVPAIVRYPGSDVTLLATMTDGSIYVTHFACRTVLAGFLDRPIFRGIEVSWLGEVTECGAKLNAIVFPKEA